MTSYKYLWEKEREKSRQLVRELREAQQHRDQYLSFIRDGHKEEFMWWLLNEMGITLDADRPKCVSCGLEDGACICAHLVAS